jgi:hypothetical protein
MTRAKIIVRTIGIIILLGIVVFILLSEYYPPLKLYLSGGEIPVSSNEIQFWIKKVPQKNYYKLCARYLKDPDKTEDPEFGHAIFFEMGIGPSIRGYGLIFNPEDNKIYGGDWWEKKVYPLIDGKIDGNSFIPIFLEGTKFTFRLPEHDFLTWSDAPAYYITIYLPHRSNKLTDEELKKPSIAEIIEGETRIKN